MYVSEVVVKSGSEIVLEIREVRGLRALTALMIVELVCSHEGPCSESFCLVSPPGWAWKIGIGSPFSLGSLLWRVGQWATCMNHQLVREEPVNVHEAIELFGWDREALDLSLGNADDSP